MKTQPPELKRFMDKKLSGMLSRPGKPDLHAKALLICSKDHMHSDLALDRKMC